MSSNIVTGAQLYRSILPQNNDGTTAKELADLMLLHVRTVQRHLVAMERAGLIVHLATIDGERHWWRA